MSAWTENRPIFKRLPQYAWQDQNPPVSDWVTSPYDQVLMELQGAIANFPQDFIDPDTCRADALDWLAQLMGYTGEYWDSMWSEAVKRKLIKDAQTVVWRYKGTYYLLQYLIDTFELKATIRIRGAWRIGSSAIGDPIGGPLLSYSLVIGSDTDPGYVRLSAEWRLLERLNRLYMPCWVAAVPLNGNHLHYHRWRVGRSQVGDPI